MCDSRGPGPLLEPIFYVMSLTVHVYHLNTFICATVWLQFGPFHGFGDAVRSRQVRQQQDRGLVSTWTTTNTSMTFDSVQQCRLLDKFGWYSVDEHWFHGWLGDQSKRIAKCSTHVAVTWGYSVEYAGANLVFLLLTYDLPSCTRHSH